MNYFNIKPNNKDNTINLFDFCSLPGNFIYGIMFYCKFKGYNLNWKA
jgi:hypothetical protein